MKRILPAGAVAIAMSAGLIACGAVSDAPSRGTTALAPASHVASPVTSSAPTTDLLPSPSATSAPLASPNALPAAGRILFVIEGGGESRPVYLDPNGLHEIPTTRDPTLSHAVWASEDSIVFDSERDVRRHIFRMGRDGGDIVELSSGDAIEERPAVSPDGSMIAYAEFVDAPLGADLGLHLADADGSNARTLTVGGKAGTNGGDTGPSFSPDGRWIAFERAIDFDAGKAGLFIINTDGTGLRRLADDALGAGYPRWSPDGKRILFTEHLDATTFAPGPLWVVDVGVGAPRPLTDPNDPGWAFAGDWSPDGRQVVFDYFLPALGQPQLRVVDANGTNSSTLLVGGGETPDWGP
jgi:Tol biopolymer transport system component